MVVLFPLFMYSIFFNIKIFLELLSKGVIWAPFCCECGYESYNQSATNFHHAY